MVKETILTRSDGSGIIEFVFSSIALISRIDSGEAAGMRRSLWTKLQRHFGVLLR
jgi:hypothetical protein